MRKRLGALTKNVAIYGAGDVAITAVNLLLLPLYLRVLTQEDMGAILLLVGTEAILKLLFRLGLDGAFMRYYHDRPEGPARQRFTSTLLAFLAVSSGATVVVLWLATPWLTRALFADHAPAYMTAFRLVLCNTFLLTFTFVPYQVMRLRGEVVRFSVISFARAFATLLLRVALVLVGGYGVTGLAIADLAVTMALLPVLWPWTRPLLRWEFSRSDLKEGLRFGLPRLPHGLAQQAFDAGNKMLLGQYIPLSQLGIYNIATTLGQSLKFFLSAFETGWAPFYYETARQPDARVTFAKVTTYGVALLALLVAGITAIGADLVRLIAPADYAGANTVIPLIALGIAFQGVYLLTSIGLNLTSRTEYYPVSTIAAAVVGLGSGLFLMPTWGAMGAGVSFLLAYLTLAVVAGHFARRHYPVPYEGARLMKVLVAAVMVTAGAWLMPTLPPVVGVLLRGVATVVGFAGLLWLLGFFRETERAWLRERWRRVRTESR